MKEKKTKPLYRRRERKGEPNSPTAYCKILHKLFKLNR